MIQETPQADRFKEQLRDSLQMETLNAHAFTIPKHSHVYTCGDQDEMIYFIVNGQVKLLMISPEGMCFVQPPSVPGASWLRRRTLANVPRTMTSWLPRREP